MPPTPPRTHFVGCGRVGLTLGRLFTRRGLIRPACVLTRSRDTADAAIAFLGGGRAVTRVQDLDRADLLLVLTSDSEIEGAAHRLLDARAPLHGTAVVHASGALSSEVLSPLRALGARVASIHPIRSFPAALEADDLLDGVVCGAEGDPDAIGAAAPLFTACGARVVTLEPGAKRLYHAAAVLACNHLVGLVESSLEVYAAAGIDRALALEALEPLMRGTLDNVFARGPEHALSGPVVRGEAELIAEQLARLGSVSKRLRALYRDLALQTLPLARRVGSADAARLDALERVLRDADRERGGD